MTCPDGYTCYRIWSAAETFAFFAGFAVLILAIMIGLALVLRLITR